MRLALCKPVEKGMVLHGHSDPEPVPVPERTPDHIITGLPIPMSCLTSSHIMAHPVGPPVGNTQTFSTSFSQSR